MASSNDTCTSQWNVGNVRRAQLSELSSALRRGIREVEIGCIRREKHVGRSGKDGGRVRDTLDFTHREHVSGRFSERERRFSDKYNGNWEEEGDCVPRRGDEYGAKSMGRRRVGGSRRIEPVGDKSVVRERVFNRSENN